MSRRCPVFVLDGNENQAVAAVRSLHRAGWRVIVGSDTSWSKAGWSRFASGSFRYPPAQADARAFVTSVAEELSRHAGGIVLPMTERTTLPLSRDRAIIGAAGGKLVLPSHETVLRAFDKEETTALAKQLAVDVPATVVVDDARGIADAARLRFPVVIKPRNSHEYVAGLVRATGAPMYARDADELERAWAVMATRCRSALVQEFIEGSGAGYFALMHHGEVRAEFAHRRIRDVRPTGSGSSLRESIAVPAALREPALAILRALEWHGAAMVEFRVRRDGTPTFLEVNGRFWNSLALAVYAGVDFPALVAAMAENGDVPMQGPYAAGVRCRWFLGDARHVAEVLRGAPAGFAGAWPSRLRTIIDVLTPAAGTFHDNFEWRDPWPAVGDWLHFALHTLPRRASADRVRSLHAAGRPSPS